MKLMQNDHFKGQSVHSIVAAIFSILFAFVLWLFIQGEEAPDYVAKYNSVEVGFRGLPEGLSIISGSESTCTISLSGKRRDLVSVKSSNIESYIDLSGISSAGVYDIDVMVLSPEGSSVTEIFPQKIQVMVDVTLAKSVPVQIEKGGYTLGENTVLDIVPEDTVLNLVGPKTIVDTVSNARVSTGDLGNVDSSFERNLSYTLIDTQGNAINSSFISSDKKTVTVDFNVYKTKTVETRLDFEYNYWGSDVTYKLTPSTVTIKGEPNFVDTIESIAVAKIDETSVNSNRIFKKFAPDSFILPEGITLSGKVGEVQADISITNNIAKTIKVPLNPNSAHFHITGLKEGCTATFKPDYVDLVVRGSATELNSASISDFHLYVDLSSLEAGQTENVEVKIVQTETTKNKFYAVGTYFTNAKISENQ